jgi:copper resistance protein D
VDTQPTTICFIAARFVHFASCLVILGVWLFDRLVIQRPDKSWRRIIPWLIWPALGAAIISGIAWFAFVTINMSGLSPEQAIKPEVLRLVWRQTHFGSIWRLRGGFLLLYSIAAILIFLLRRDGLLKSTLVWLAIGSGAILLGSLAWAGHGQFGEPARWHLLADALHLVVAAMWPTGLLPLSLYMACLRRMHTARRWEQLPPVVNRFSAASLVSVSVLAVTGTVNTCYMLRSVSDFFLTSYGRVLLTKILLFCAIVSIGAFNLLRLKPRISAGEAIEVDSTTPTPIARLQLTVGAELVLGTVVVLIVALLGLLMPPQM